MSFKLEGPTESRLCEERPPSPKPSKSCVACGKKCKKVIKCETCVSGCYCSKNCRDGHVSTDEHQLLCISIQQLEEIQMNKRLAALPIREKNQVSLKRKLVSLVGEKPIVNCFIDGQKSEALWDTGAMVSVVNTDWLAEKYPCAEIQSIQQFLEGDSLHLVTANNSPISIRGVVVLNVDIGRFCVLTFLCLLNFIVLL